MWAPPDEVDFPGEQGQLGGLREDTGVPGPGVAAGEGLMGVGTVKGMGWSQVQGGLGP